MMVSRKTVSAIAKDILQAMGAPCSTAERVVESLLAAERRNVRTHGFSLLPLYLEMTRVDAIKPQAEPTSRINGQCMATVNGQGAFGQLTGQLAVETGLQLVENQGMAAVGIVDGTHLGRLGEWAEGACKAGVAFIALSNTGGGALNVAGAGGARRVLAPNPIAFGIPTCGRATGDVIVDFASSQVSGSRIRELANTNKSLDPDWVICEDGSATEDPKHFLDGLAALRPLGGASAGHKGFGLMVAAEMLAALAGGHMAGEKKLDWFSNSAIFLFLDVSRFASPEEWGSRAESFAKYIESCGYRLPGSDSQPLAGENLDMADHTVAALLALAAELHVDARGLQSTETAPKVTRTW